MSFNNNILNYYHERAAVIIDVVAHEKPGMIQRPKPLNTVIIRFNNELVSQPRQLDHAQSANISVPPRV